jgi:hypothetical protein
VIGTPVHLTMHVEHVHPGFTKWHLNQAGEQPWPFRPVLHHFTTPDVGEPHDHPWDFTTTVLRGAYVEEVWTKELCTGAWLAQRFLRGVGDRVFVNAEHIHRIVELPEGECWTLCEYGPCRRESLFYRFDGDRVITRPWHQAEAT